MLSRLGPMRAQTGSALLLVVAACTTPDIGPDVAAFGKAVTQSAEPIAKQLQQEMAVEERRIRNRRIAAGQSVYTVTPQCYFAGQGLVDANTAATGRCALEPTYTAELAQTEAARMNRLMGGLRAYLAALQALQTHDGSASGQIAGQIVTQMNDLADTTDSRGLQRLALMLTSRQAAISGGVDIVVSQAQYSALRRAVTGADPAVTQVASILEAHFDNQPGNPHIAATTRLRAAERRVQDLRNSGNPQAYGAALTQLEARIVEAERARQDSPSAALSSIAKTHRALANRLRRPADANELIGFLEQLNMLRGALTPPGGK